MSQCCGARCGVEIDLDPHAIFHRRVVDRHAFRRRTRAEGGFRNIELPGPRDSRWCLSLHAGGEHERDGHDDRRDADSPQTTSHTASLSLNETRGSVRRTDRFVNGIRGFVGTRAPRTARDGTVDRHTRSSRSRPACAVPARSWQHMPTNAPVKFGSPGAVASSDRMLASNCCGSQCQSSVSTRYANCSRS